jgi:hypothetical protein
MKKADHVSIVITDEGGTIMGQFEIDVNSTFYMPATVSELVKMTEEIYALSVENSLDFPAN